MLLNQDIQFGDITRLEVFSNDSSRSVDIRSAINEFYYYESILENTIAANVVFTDTGFSLGNKDIFEELNMQGAEKVLLAYKDAKGREISFAQSGKEFYVNQINKVAENSLSTTISLGLVTKEFLDNEYLDKRVVQRYDGKISDIILRILKENLKTRKNIFVHETINEESVHGKFDFPLELCTTLASRSIPNIPNSKSKTGGYFFFETYDGFNFHSIDKMLDYRALPYKSYIYTSSTELPISRKTYNGKIIKVDSYYENINVKDKLKKGTYGHELAIFDSITDSYQKDLGITKDQQMNGIKLAGRNLPDFGPNFSGKTKRTFLPLANYTYNKQSKPEKQLENASDEFIEIKNVIAQSESRYNQLFAIQLTITVPFDSTLRAGDIILCDFPEISSNKNSGISNKKSGIYMIADLCHYITPKTGSYTKMNLVRDSYGRIN